MSAAATRSREAERFAEVVRRRRRRRLRSALAVVATLAVLGVLAWTVLATSALGVRRVVVTGTHRLAVAQVLAAADVPRQHPLATLDVAGITRRVADLAPVASVHVERSWPHTVRIAVTERVPAAAVPARGGGDTLIDATGMPFATVTAAPKGLPVIAVDHPGPADSATRAALAVVDALPPAVLKRVTEIRAPGPSSVQLRLAGGKTVIWGDASRSDRKAAVLAALLKRPGTVYDVSTPDIVTVK